MMRNSPISYPYFAKRAVSLINHRFYTSKFSSRSLTAVPNAQNIESLRALSAATFAKHDFRDIQWAGVFGSFARGTQTGQSDVDIVVYQKPLNEPSPPDRLHLEEVLPRVWSRAVDIVYIEDGEFCGYISVESLLCSQTIYGSSRGEEVMQLRRKASDILESGHKHYANILQMIRQVQLTMKGVSQEAFIASPTFQQSTLSLIMSIFGYLNSKPHGHPMREAFWYILIEQSREIQNRLDVENLQPEFWKTVWQIASQSTSGTLGNLARRIEKLVFPVLDGTRAMSELTLCVVIKAEYRVKDKSVLLKYPGVFGDVYQLVGQRYILAHQYGHAE